MANRARAKGTAWESAIRDFLNRALGLVHADGRFLDPTDPDNVRRQPQEGVRDVGDLWARPFVLEAKAEKSYDLASYVRQAEREAEAAGLPFGVAVVKRPRARVEDGYVVLSLRTFARVLQYLRDRS
ncbi:hypothetical protein [Nocardiopsis alba]|uniref:hypothetical protein n=1 Tax=Nocardiopsis alba TaxID=53437 RepID=UPI003D716AF4